MQLLCDQSEEGTSPGLGIIPGSFKKFQPKPGMKIPHMGWNTVEFSPKEAELRSLLSPHPKYYFVHSFHYYHDSDDYIIGYTDHGIRFAAAIRNKHAIGFQFHPEKSHRYGMELLDATFKAYNA